MSGRGEDTAARLVRWSRSTTCRGAILLYHRVNDISKDVLTAGTERFAQHLIALRHYYRVVPTTEVVCAAPRRGGKRGRAARWAQPCHGSGCRSLAGEAREEGPRVHGLAAIERQRLFPGNEAARTPRISRHHRDKVERPVAPSAPTSVTDRAVGLAGGRRSRESARSCSRGTLPVDPRADDNSACVTHTA